MRDTSTSAQEQGTQAPIQKNKWNLVKRAKTYCVKSLFVVTEHTEQYITGTNNLGFLSRRRMMETYTVLTTNTEIIYTLILKGNFQICLNLIRRNSVKDYLYTNIL